MDILNVLIYLVIAGFILFLIIACAVKMAVKEALYEFKEDIIKELSIRKVQEDNKGEGKYQELSNEK